MGNQSSYTEDDIFWSKVLKCGMYPVLAFVRGYLRTTEQREKQMNDVKNFMTSMGISYSPPEFTKEDEAKMIKHLSRIILLCNLDKKDFVKAPVKMDKYRTLFENMANGIIQSDILQLLEELGNLPTQ